MFMPFQSTRKPARGAPPRVNRSQRRNCASTALKLIHGHVKPPALSEDSRILTVSARVRGALRTASALPSPWPSPTGRGNSRRQVFGCSGGRRADTALGCAESQRRILPLPKGEGWGEGEGDARRCEPRRHFPRSLRIARGTVWL